MQEMKKTEILEFHTFSFLLQVSRLLTNKTSMEMNCQLVTVFKSFYSFFNIFL